VTRPLRPARTALQCPQPRPGALPRRAEDLGARLTAPGSLPKGFERMGIPLRPDPLALSKMQRRSFNRAVAAMAMTTRRGTTSSGTQPEEVLRANWADDDAAGRILKAASSPLETSNFAAIQSNVVLPMLSPDAASSRLLNLGSKLNLDGINTIRLPFIGGGGRPPSRCSSPKARPRPWPI
jgi:hypothetical protein